MALTTAAWALAIACTAGDSGNGTLSGGANGSAAADDSGGGQTTGDAGDTDPSGDAATSDPSSASGGSSGTSTGADTSASAGDDGTTTSAGGSSSSAGDSTSGGDLADGVLDVTIVAHNDCTITTMPASITVPEGTEFTVNWISAATSEVPVDVAKIDRFNAVPIILGMEPGTAYHDEVRVWCGELFTGTFDFEITSCFDPQYIPVDCGG